MRLSGLNLIVPKVFPDARGYFFESYREHLGTFPQDNISFSKKNVLRALHYQSVPGQAKLVSCLQGKIWDVAVDIRPDSPTFGQWEATFLDDISHHQFFIPVGFAHGYCVLSDTALVHYKVSALFDPETEMSIRWNDPDLAIAWPIQHPILSLRDQQSPFWREVCENLGARI